MLFAKELRESRAALLAGLIIFWLMPAMWSLVYYFIEPRSIMGGVLAWMLLVAAGWLYAVIVGAQTVCRDWGRPEEHFLLSRPISPRQAVWAKLCAGLLTVLLVVFVASGWALLLMTHSREYAEQTISPTEWAGVLLESWLPVVLVIVIGYLLAFAAGVLTRQMLGSVILAIFALLIWIAAPLLSTRLGFLHPAWMWETPAWKSASMAGSSAKGLGAFLSHAVLDPFWLVISIVTIGLAAVAVVFAGKQSRLHLGYKSLAWGIAMTALLLFAGATREVGNSLRVKDQAGLDLPSLYVDQLVNTDSQFVAIGNMYTEKHTLPLAAFQLDDNGKIRDLRTSDVAMPEIHHSLRPEYLLDGQGRLVATFGPFTDAESDQGVTRMVLDWPAGRDPNVISRGTAQSSLAGKDKSVHLAGWTSTLRYSYLVYDLQYPGPDVRSWQGADRPHELCVFAWDQGQARLVKEIPVSSQIGVWILDGRLAIYRCHPAPTPSRDFRLEVAAFDPDRPESLGDGSGWRYASQEFSSAELHFWQLRKVLADPAERVFVGYSNTALTPDGRVAFISRPFDLDVEKQTEAGQWNRAAELGMSPLAFLFRRQTWPELLGRSLLMEQTDSTLFFYDVSTPTHPRRTGFFHAYPRSVTATQRHLVIREDNLITVLDRPVPGEPAGPICADDHWQLPVLD